MAKRVFLHIGTPKTGTTYLQRLLWTNKAELESQGLLLPLESVRDHYFLSNLGRDAEEDVIDMPRRALGAWDRMMEQVSAWEQDALISHELFAMTLPHRAVWIIDQLRSVADEVHPIITARDLARQVPAEWQQSIKHGRTHKLREFYGLIRAQDPSILFWRAQELPSQVRMWGQGLPPENVHLITVPPRDGRPDQLWERFASVLPIDPTKVEPPDEVPNVSLGLVEVEMLRRVNAFAPMGASKPLQQMMVRQVLGDGILAQRSDAKRFAPPEEEHPWVVAFGTAMVDELRTLECDVVGDLDELLPPVEPVRGPVPDDVDDSEIAAAAVETISAVLYRTHEREHSKAENEIARLKQGNQTKAAELRDTRTRLKAAQHAYDVERAVPLWRHTARRVKSLGRSLARRPRT